MTAPMNPEKKTIWVEALRSGTYSQAISSFSLKNLEGVVEHCCLAVLAHEAANHGAPGIRWPEGATEPEVVALYQPYEGWGQLRDGIEETMASVQEVNFKTPEIDLPEGESWAWAPASEFTEGLLPACVQEWAEIEGDNPYLGGAGEDYLQASSWNDVAKADFGKIADLVETSL